MNLLKEYVDKATVFNALKGNSVKFYKDVHLVGIKNGEQFHKHYIYNPDEEKWVFTDKSTNQTIETDSPYNDIKKMFSKGYVFDTYVEETDSLLISFTENSEINETTMSGSSGSYEVPFGGVTKAKNMDDNNNIVEVNEHQFEEMVKKTLVYEFVYNSEAGKSTESNKGEKESADTKKRIKAVDDSQKTNIKDEEQAVPVYNQKSNPIARDEDEREKHRIEAHQNGQQDIKYDSISEKAKEQIKKGFEEGGKAGEQLLADAKARAESEEQYKTDYAQLGNDIEKTGKDYTDKPTVVEGLKKHTLKDKSILTEEEDLEYVLSVKRKLLEGKIFFLEDFVGNRMKIDWTGKQALVLSNRNVVKENEYSGLRKRLMANAKDVQTKEEVNESNFFTSFFNKMNNK